MIAHLLIIRRSVLPLTLLLLVCLAVGASLAPAQQSQKASVFTDFRSKLALDGYDPVSYFKQGKPTKGNPAHAVTWNGASWHFSSAENKAAFEANPQAYAPQFGGYCAWAVSQGYTAKGDPHAWRIVDNKLYVNYNASVQKTWEKDIPGHIVKGDKNWPNVLTK
jgi:YHS domain-containing protein